MSTYRQDRDEAEPSSTGTTGSGLQPAPSSSTGDPSSNEDGQENKNPATQGAQDAQQTRAPVDKPTPASALQLHPTRDDRDDEIRRGKDEQPSPYPSHELQRHGEQGRHPPQRNELLPWHDIAGDVLHQLQLWLWSDPSTHDPILAEAEERVARYIPTWLRNATVVFYCIVVLLASVLSKILDLVAYLLDRLVILLRRLGLIKILLLVTFIGTIMLVISIISNLGLVLGEIVCSFSLVKRASVCQGKRFGGLEPQIPRREFPKCSSNSNEIDDNWCMKQHVLHVAPDLDAILATLSQFASLLRDVTDIQDSDHSMSDLPRTAAKISTTLDKVAIGDADFHSLRKARAADDCTRTETLLQHTRSRPAGAALWHRHLRGLTSPNERQWERLTEPIKFWWEVTVWAQPRRLLQKRAKLFSRLVTDRSAAEQAYFKVANMTGSYLVELEKAVCGTLGALQDDVHQAARHVGQRVEEERDVVPRSQMLHLSKARSREDMGKSLCRVLSRSVLSVRLVLEGLNEDRKGIDNLSEVASNFVKSLKPKMRPEALDTWTEADELESKLWKLLETFWCYEDWPADNEA